MNGFGGEENAGNNGILFYANTVQRAGVLAGLLLSGQVSISSVPQCVPVSISYRVASTSLSQSEFMMSYRINGALPVDSVE